MQVLYAPTQDDLASAQVLFTQYMEPLLTKLEHAARNDHSIGSRRLAHDYLSVCRWPFRRLEYSFAMASILERPVEGGSALDAGSGVTPLAHALAGLGYSVIACDSDRALMQDLAAGSMDHVYGSTVTYEYQDLTALGYPDATFDLITCISVVEHIAAPCDQTALTEMLRVLKPGGQLVLTVDYEPSPTTASLTGRHGRRLWEYARHGGVLGAAKAVGRKLWGRQAIAGGLARHVRTANQPFSRSHLVDDLLPLLTGGTNPVAVPFALPPERIHAEDVPAFWNLIPGLFDRNGSRLVLPAAVRYVKPFS